MSPESARAIPKKLAVAFCLLLAACGNEPAAELPDPDMAPDAGSGTARFRDAQPRDASAEPPDATNVAADVGPAQPDGSPPVDASNDGAANDDGGPRADADQDGGEDATDGATPIDAAVQADAGSPADGAFRDAAVLPDATPIDTGPVIGPPEEPGGDFIAATDEGDGLVDTDGDGYPDSQDGDSDDDLILDRSEAGDLSPLTPPIDTDRDGIPDFRDPDSDGDGIPDLLEAGDASTTTPPIDSDFDGVPNFLDLDSDNDSIVDRDEGALDSDGDGLADAVDIDSDNDSLLDMIEAGDTSTTTPAIDSDGDGIPDYRDIDSDGDTITDLIERSVDFDGDGIENRLDLDSDNDGASDRVEAGDLDLATRPVDLDGDMIEDYLDLDSDGDGLSDEFESGCPSAPDRALRDSDGDSFLDPAEIAFASNPCDPASVIEDFYFELPPLGPTESAPLIFDDTGIDRADFAINMDTTSSMDGEIANLVSSLSTVIIPGVNAAVPNAAFSVSAFDDYPVNPFGSSDAGDLPFRLIQRVTTSGPAAQAAVNALETHEGDDLPESGIESLYQIATGFGTSWAGGSVGPFDSALGRVDGVADGAIGGVGFRSDSLPVIVHVTDAASHVQADYTAVDPQITAATTAATMAALSSIGARVVTIANESLPRPPDALIGGLCNHTSPTSFGAIAAPVNTDADWFELSGAVAGDTVTVETMAARAGSSLDSIVAIYDGLGLRIGFNYDIALDNIDARMTMTLAGPAPFYVTVSAWQDSDFNGTDGGTSGFYFLDVSVNGTPFSRTTTECRTTDDANGRTGATLLVPFASSVGPQSATQCMSTCDALTSVENFTLPYGMSEATGAVIPACAWDRFGAGRPAGCAADQCCTGLDGAGESTNESGLCPLSFRIDANGSGLGSAVVSGIEALVTFSSFTITTVTRPDPLELVTSGIDTRCFIQSVVPQSAAPSACAPSPVLADLLPPFPELDSFENVVPGTTLTFQVNARNQDRVTASECAPSELNMPRLFRAFIDVVADGVTVVDTRDVIIIVPPEPPQLPN